jgi:hypothetical protein
LDYHNQGRDQHFFEQVRIGSFGELIWGDQIDLSLFLRVTGRKPEDVFWTGLNRFSPNPALRD